MLLGVPHVQATAAYGFLQAYHAYVQPLFLSERDRYYAEGISAAALYGATSAPTSEADLERLLHATSGRLEPSNIVFEFLAIMRSAPILPLPLRPVQHPLVRAKTAQLISGPGPSRQLAQRSDMSGVG